MSSDTADHVEAQELLPWLANGTLGGVERARVEQHVRACLACRVELDELRALAQVMRTQPALPVSAEGGFERLRLRIDKQAPARAAYRARFAAAACLAVAAFAGMAGLVLQGARAPDFGAYRTLAEPSGASELIDVVFAAGVTEAQMRMLLTEHAAEIIAGPSPRVGRYTLRRAGGIAEGEVDALIERLNADARVRFASRAYARPDAVESVREQDLDSVPFEPVQLPDASRAPGQEPGPASAAEPDI